MDSIGILFLAGFLSFAAIPASSDRILFLMPIATKSETHLLIPLVKQMLDKGNEVTFVSPAVSGIQHKNLTEIIPVTPLTMAEFLPVDGDVLDIRRAKDDKTAIISVDMSYMYDRCHATYQHKDFEPILKSQPGSFQLVVTSAFFSECFLGLIHQMQAPFIVLCSMALPQHINDVTGLRTPLSFVPSPFIPMTDKMTLSERLENTFSSWMFSLLSYHHFFKVSENIYKQYLGDDLPDVETLRKNVSLIFSNTHFSLNFPRPLMPDVIEIGGVHCHHPANPLPKDLEDFVSGDKNGFIFFSLGTVFREETMNDGLMKTFINVFSRLKLRVLWKWGSGNIEGLSSNVKVSKWLPQKDLLGHPNIKLFISHGGLLSTQEATYHGVPVLGIPLFVDQDINMKQAEAHGYALKLELLDITEEYLENAINRMLNNSSFTTNAKLASEIFRHQPQNPLERAVFWMDYVIKYKGAPHLRSSARDLSYIEYYLYDVQLIIISILGTIVLIVWKIISCILQRSSREGDDSKKIRRRKKVN
ncbi:UDP-glucuronosyltransferase 2A3 [Orchesella cincta]|uniref:UDP-glucuronosyltransferase 2A3 n=1 Tax=Orchesella cincta TaxID=48709 RepID=A0A1D2MPL8_ORCCI|nr:UDP-glucuronosyltransferase 2A3 [Orchesella cincta]